MNPLPSHPITTELPDRLSPASDSPKSSLPCTRLANSRKPLPSSSNDRPLVSVITVSLNSAKYLEQTIRSVLDQTYDRIEYLVIDGASTDGTLDIIRRHESGIHTWISEPDQNMYDAINKGILRCSGDIVAVLNSDDMYPAPDTIERMIENTRRFPEWDGWYGDCIKIYPDRARYQKFFQINHRRFLLAQRGTFIPHAGLFLRRRCLEYVGLYDTRYHFAADYDFLLRCLRQFRFKYIPRPYLVFRVHPESITASGRIRRERIALLKEHGVMNHSPLSRRILHACVWSRYIWHNLIWPRSARPYRRLLSNAPAAHVPSPLGETTP